jgi:hypothetical protein
VGVIQRCLGWCLSSSLIWLSSFLIISHHFSHHVSHHISSFSNLGNFTATIFSVIYYHLCLPWVFLPLLLAIYLWNTLWTTFDAFKSLLLTPWAVLDSSEGLVSQMSYPPLPLGPTDVIWYFYMLIHHATSRLRSLYHIYYVYGVSDALDHSKSHGKHFIFYPFLHPPPDHYVGPPIAPQAC